MGGTQMEIKCPECGGTKFRYPDKPELESSDPMTCVGCGLDTTVGELRQEGFKQAQKILSDAFGDRFKPKK